MKIVQISVQNVNFTSNGSYFGDTPCMAYLNFDSKIEETTLLRQRADNRKFCQEVKSSLNGLETVS